MKISIDPNIWIDEYRDSTIPIVQIADEMLRFVFEVALIVRGHVGSKMAAQIEVIKISFRQIRSERICGANMTVVWKKNGLPEKNEANHWFQLEAPFSSEQARQEARVLLTFLQRGVSLDAATCSREAEQMTAWAGDISFPPAP